MVKRKLNNVNSVWPTRQQLKIVLLFKYRAVICSTFWISFPWVNMLNRSPLFCLIIITHNKSLSVKVILFCQQNTEMRKSIGSLSKKVPFWIHHPLPLKSPFLNLLFVLPSFEKFTLTLFLPFSKENILNPHNIYDFVITFQNNTCRL